VTGIYSAWLATRPTGLTYIREFTIESSNTWEFFQVTFPGYTGAVIADSAAAGLQLGITFSSSTLTGAVGEWQAGNDQGGSANQVNGVSSTSNNILTTGWMLEVGEIATDFPHEDYGTTLDKCQRYYEIITGDTASQAFASGSSVSTTASAYSYRYRTQKRANPTVTFAAADQFAIYHRATVTVADSVSGSLIGSDSCQLNAGDTGGALTAGDAAILRRQSNGALITFSAEL
jgi:hypothetical protein